MSAIPGNNIVNVADLDTAFPVPGQDNDSQGFRDNFTVIDNNFTSTKARLEDLEANAVRIDRDPGISSFETTNVFVELSGGSGTARLINPTLQSHREVKYDVGDVITNATIRFSGDQAGSYQTIVMTGDTELTINAASAPDSGFYQKVILHITATGSTRNLTWDNGVTIKFDTESEGFWHRDDTRVSSIPVGDVHIIELWTYQGSTTYFAKYVGSFN